MLRYIVLALLLFAASILIGGSHPQLPSSAEKFLIEGFLGNKGRVATIEYIRQRRIADFDYLGVQAVFEVRDNFEHPRAFQNV